VRLELRLKSREAEGRKRNFLVEVNDTVERGQRLQVLPAISLTDICRTRVKSHINSDEYKLFFFFLTQVRYNDIINENNRP